MIIPIIILAIVFILIALRKVGNIRFKIWQIMLLGAAAVLLTGQITPIDALKSIDVDVMLFLFGMFVIGNALEESGYLSHLSYKFFKKAKTLDHLILFILFGMGFASAFLMNDTLAIIGTPVVLLLARKHGTSSKVLLLTLAFAVTIGSVFSPIGNPQNLLIALNGDIANPFITFFKFLFIPTMINLLLAYFIMKFFYREHFNDKSLKHSQEPIKDHELAILSKISLLMVVVLIIINVLTVFLKLGIDFKLTYIALISAAPIIVFSLFSRKFSTIKNIDWHTLVFFAAMFVLMKSVWTQQFKAKAGCCWYLDWKHHR